MNELDFTGKTVLVVGGSSGIGNGIAQAFRTKGATVHVYGTRARAADYAREEGSDLEGLHYGQLDVSDPKAFDLLQPTFDGLDVLVLAQGTVIYKRGEFAMPGFRQVLDVNLTSLMACGLHYHEMLKKIISQMLDKTEEDRGTVQASANDAAHDFVDDGMVPSCYNFSVAHVSQN